jgi:hypothetical protein
VHRGRPERRDSAGSGRALLHRLRGREPGVDLGADATVEDMAENFAKIIDLSGAKPRNMLQMGG